MSISPSSVVDDATQPSCKLGADIVPSAAVVVAQDPPEDPPEVRRKMLRKMQRDERRAERPTLRCPGCIDNQPGQDAHTDEGGCLHWSVFEAYSDVSSDDGGSPAKVAKVADVADVAKIVTE